MLSYALETLVVTPEGSQPAGEKVLSEAPVEILLNDEPAGTAMVLPSDLEELAVGYLFGQGRLNPGDTVYAAEVCEDAARVNVHADANLRPEEEMITTSGCGGTGRIAERLLSEDFPAPAELTLGFRELRELVESTLACSPLREETHCVHGCGYFSNRAFQVCYEDVGRHNAVDKLLGAVFLGQYSPVGAVYTTGRLTSDMVLKCARMGIPVLLSRTAPSSLGLEIAQRAGLTLGCYVRPGRVNVFNAPQRILSRPDS